MSFLRRQSTGGTRDSARLEAFSDGVIAIAITLLVLEIHIPTEEETESNRALWEHLGNLWPSYLGYIISFAVIGIMWANHHSIFKHVRDVDHYLVLINLLLLGCIAFIPFTTGVLSEHLKHGGEQAAAIFYSGFFLFTALVYNLMWRYVIGIKPALLEPEADPETIRTITRRFNLGPPGYLAAFVAAFIWVPASLAIILFLALLYLLPQD
jgi:TMEM175 potassium channel family protein